MRFTPFVLGIVLMEAPAGSLGAQVDPDPAQPRPPLLLEASRTERLEAAVRLYLAELIMAIQRGDTVALKSLVPDEVVPDGEKLVAGRAGCSSLGAAAERLRAGRAKEAPNPALPLSGVILGVETVTLGPSGDTVARVLTRIMERRDGRVRYATIELAFVEVGGSWRVGPAKGILAGTCGMALLP